MISPKERILILFDQITNGCGTFECDNCNCKSSIFYKYGPMSNNDAAIIAINLAKNFSRNVCSGIDVKFRNLVALEKAKMFSDWVRNAMDSDDDSFDLEEAVKLTTEIFTDEDIFCNLFRTNNEIIKQNKLDINEDLLIRVSYFLNKHSSFFCGFKNDFWKIAKKLVSYVTWDNGPLTLNRNRGMIMLTVFNIFFEEFDGHYSENFGEFIDTLYPESIKTIIENRKQVKAPRGSEIFIESLGNYPKLLNNFIEACHTNLTLCFCNNNGKENFKKDGIPPKDALRIALFFKFVSLKLRNNYYVPDSTFYNDTFTNEMVAQVARSQMFILDVINSTSTALDLHFKYEALRAFLTSKQDDAARMNFLQILQRGAVNPNDFQFIMEVDRGNIIQDTLDILAKTPPEVLERRLNVVFKGEAGVDAGGVSRELFFNLAEMFSPDHGMFQVVNDRHWFRRDTVESGLMFNMLGTVVALAIYNGITLPIRFPVIMFKKLCNIEPQLRDLEEVEPEIYHTLSKLMQMVDAGEDISDVGLTFAVSYEMFDEVKVVELLPDGANKEVNNDNFMQYVESYLNWAVTDSIASSYKAFERGYKKLCDREVFRSFSPYELSLIVSGEEVFDWAALRSEAKYSDGYTADSQAVKWFWEVFEELSEELKVKFLLFSTGSDKAPIGGLGSVQLVIQRTGDPEKLPVAHTCFNIFALPDYESKDVLRARLLIALDNTVGFGLK